MFFPLKSTDRVSLLNRAPLQTSQDTLTSGRKLISIFFDPCPSQGFAASSVHIEREASRTVSPDGGFGGLGKQSAYPGPETDIGGGAGAGSFPMGV